MKTYKTQAEVEKDIKNEVLAINDDVTFECDISINASINAWNINAGNIDAVDINARNIDAVDINARNIDAVDINALNIDAGNIDAGDIDAGNIDARDIKARDVKARDVNVCNIVAWDINAVNISYYAFCNVYGSIKCSSIKAKREVHHAPVCLDGKLIIKKPETNLSGKKVSVELDGKKYTAD